jgi:hypothetical protein
MLFLLNEQIMNGTVIMSILSTGVEAPGFEGAKEKIRANIAAAKKASDEEFRCDIHQDTDSEFSYTIGAFTHFPCYGRMENKPLRVI